MNRRPRALDLFCCQGGASAGLHMAGFDVVGVDIEEQSHYRFDFHKADALTFPLGGFDFIWASPPCQAHSRAQKIRQNDHPDLIEPIRERLQKSGKPFCIENVVGAPLIDPIMLCGSMFGLQTYRHRLFECSFPIAAPSHPEHHAPLAKMGRPVRDGEFMHVVGNFSGATQARRVMGMPWASRDGLREAIPPVYARFIGMEALALIEAKRAAA